MSIEVMVKTCEKALNTDDIESILSLCGRSPVFGASHCGAALICARWDD